ncbi:hypothetical protein D3C85_1584490 [compost metagenome]
MLAGEAALHFRALELLLGNQGFQRDDLVQHRLGLDGDVHRAGAGLVSIQLGLGLF